MMFIDWLPRLERLAELRRLNQFEKNVLLTLTGCVVSRNLRESGNANQYTSYSSWLLLRSCVIAILTPMMAAVSLYFHVILTSFNSFIYCRQVVMILCLAAIISLILE